MAKHKKKNIKVPLIISGVISTLLLIYGLTSIESLNTGLVGSKLLWPVLRLMFYISLGLLAGQVIESTGWTKFMALLARPLFRFGNLGDRCSAAFTTAFFSGAAANAMLFDFYKDDNITRRQLYLTNLINQFPAYFLHIPTTFFIILPLTGMAGVLYLAITFIATLLRTLLFLIFGHFFPSKPSDEPETVTDAVAIGEKKRAEGVWQGVKQKLPGRIGGIAVYVIPIYIAVFIVNAMGFFDATRNWLAQHFVTAFIPIESLSIVILSFAAEFTSGFAAAGALMESGVLTTKQTVIALLLGNIIAFPLRALRHQLPRYIGIFAPKMGTQLLLMGQGFRIVSLIAVGMIYFILVP